MIVTKLRSKLRIGLITVVCPLIIGAILYYIFCPAVWFVQKLDCIVGATGRQPIIPHSTAGILFRYYFFDFIWAFSLANAIYIIYSNDTKVIFITVFITFALGTAMECLQFFNIAQGTFDVFDIMIEVIGSLLGVIIIKFLRRAIKNEKD